MEPMVLAFPVLVGMILVALLFDFLNGQHDAANSVATVVATRVMSPKAAVGLAAFFNFVAFAVFGLHVAATIGKGVVAAGAADPAVIFGALSGAIAWNLFTLRLGIPSSSSHALVGGLVGAAIAKAGFSAVMWGGLAVIASGIVLSPLVGMAGAMLLMLAVSWMSRRSTPHAVDGRFRFMQIVSCSLLSLGHGGNDAQKTMGIICLLLFSQGYLGTDFHVPLWVVLSCQAAMALGTLCGGWKIIRTMGTRITELKPIQGFCAETGGAVALFAATWMGVPVSSTHTITGSIVGVGAARRASAVRWGVARRVVVAWVVTLPASAAVGAACYGMASLALR